ncbi:hypothetical protein BV22DRAFT_113935 [Leucogyrophana mollusca]|uniref:Uncharacterized protein n=1 Tax=Leucogyrophana mollusca TaxID=85980 RepID=A0ACB8BVF4_9AGAM|nr:hypothetical protein BV22DRAFT_113935 [Leucogyrophana mollusca]
MKRKVRTNRQGESYLSHLTKAVMLAAGPQLWNVYNLCMKVEPFRRLLVLPSPVVRTCREFRKRTFCKRFSGESESMKNVCCTPGIRRTFKRYQRRVLNYRRALTVTRELWCNLHMCTCHHSPVLTIIRYWSRSSASPFAYPPVLQVLDRKVPFTFIQKAHARRVSSFVAKIRRDKLWKATPREMWSPTL